MAALITLKFVVPPGHLPGDYAKLYGNGGSGDIDYNTPLTNSNFELFPHGVGMYGWGHAPWGHFRWGHGHSVGGAGWGHLPWGHFPWGHSSALITAQVKVTTCGDYKFAFVTFDKAGNQTSDTPEETTVSVHIAPATPGKLKLSSYNSTTDLLTLQVA